MLTWKKIGALVFQKIFGADNRSAELNKQTEIVIKGYKELYEEQKKIIESYRVKHPGNGEELDKWKQREYEIMIELISKERQLLEANSKILFYDELVKRLEKRKRGMYE